MEAFNRLANPSHLSLIEQTDSTLEPTRRDQLKISHSLGMSEKVTIIRLFFLDRLLKH